MQNYFPETRQGRPVSMKASEGERGWREGMRGKGVTGSIGWIKRWGQRSGVACGRGRVRTGLLWRRRTTPTCMLKHGADPLRWPSAAILSRHQRALVRVSGILSRGASTSAPSWRNFTPSVSSLWFADLPNYLPLLDLPFFWGGVGGGFPRSDTHKHSLRYTIQTEATGVKIPFDGHSNVYFSTPSLFVKLL